MATIGWTDAACLGGARQDCDEDGDRGAADVGPRLRMRLILSANLRVSLTFIGRPRRKSQSLSISTGDYLTVPKNRPSGVIGVGNCFTTFKVLGSRTLTCPEYAVM